MIATRLRQLGMLLFSMLLCAVAFFQMFERTTNGFPQNYVWMLAFVSALFLTTWGLLLRFQPHADQSVMCCVLVLTGIGVTMIARLDKTPKPQWRSDSCFGWRSHWCLPTCWWCS